MKGAPSVRQQEQFIARKRDIGTVAAKRGPQFKRILSESVPDVPESRVVGSEAFDAAQLLARGDKAKKKGGDAFEAAQLLVQGSKAKVPSIREVEPPVTTQRKQEIIHLTPTTPRADKGTQRTSPIFSISPTPKERQEEATGILDAHSKPYQAHDASGQHHPTRFQDAETVPILHETQYAPRQRGISDAETGTPMPTMRAPDTYEEGAPPTEPRDRLSFHQYTESERQRARRMGRQGGGGGAPDRAANYPGPKRATGLPTASIGSMDTQGTRQTQGSMGTQRTAGDYGMGDDPSRRRPPRPIRRPGIDSRMQLIIDEIRRNRSSIRDIRDRPIRPALQIPASGPVVVSGAQKPTLQPVIQKVTVTQKINEEKKQRKRKVKTAKKTAVGGKRREYTQFKKQLKKTWSAEKKSEYVKANEAIKKIPTKQRPAARKKLRLELKQKMDLLLKQVPAAGKRTHVELTTLLSKARKLKWI